MALDVLRAAAKAPEETRDLLARLGEQASGAATAADIVRDLYSGSEPLARRSCERLARCSILRSTASCAGAMLSPSKLRTSLRMVSLSIARELAVVASGGVAFLAGLKLT